MRMSLLVQGLLISMSLLAFSCTARPVAPSFADRNQQGDDSNPGDDPNADPDSNTDTDPDSTDPDSVPDGDKGSETDETNEIQPFAALSWPKEQILPSYPAPAASMDLFILRESMKKFEAEKDLGHSVGHVDGDGWVAEKDKDQPGHMVFGPYVDNLPIGGNHAQFSLKRMGGAGENDEVAVLEAYDATDNKLLGDKRIYGKDLPKDNEYTTFSVAFSLPKYQHKLETRVHWTGAVTIKVDWTGVDRNIARDEMILFASLKGLVNRRQPRLFSYEGDAFAEGANAWLDSFKMPKTEVKEKWDLIQKYKKEVKGLIVFDPDVPDTINLATTIASMEQALIVSPALADTLSKAPYNLPILENFRGKFADKNAVYNHLFDNYWSKLDHRLLIGINPEVHTAALREYAVGTGVATIWLNPDVASESPLLDKFLTSLDRGSVYLGWWPEEEPGIIRSSKKNVATIAADWATNLTFHSGMSRDVKVKPIPVKPKLQNKLYVGFILSDGDNFQYIEHLMRKLWNNPDRGKVPMGWTISPTTLDAMPGALNFYHQTATDNDNLISGPSGIGYIYPNDWPDRTALKEFVSKTDTYMSRAGLKVITIWNTIIGATNADSGKIYGENAPSILGLTAQNTGGPISVFPNELPNMPLSCNYCTNEQAMLDHIKRAAEGWNRNEPRFIMIQAQPWTDVTPTTFRKVKEQLGADYEVVRPDHFFMLMRESKSLKKPTGTDY